MKGWFNDLGERLSLVGPEVEMVRSIHLCISYLLLFTNYPKVYWLNTTDTYYHTVSEVQESRSGLIGWSGSVLPLMRLHTVKKDIMGCII